MKFRNGMLGWAMGDGLIDCISKYYMDVNVVSLVEVWR